MRYSTILSNLAVGYFLGASVYIVEVGHVLRAFDVTVCRTVFCQYGTCINQQLQQT